MIGLIRRIVTNLLGESRWHDQAQDVGVTSIRAELARRHAARAADEVRNLNTILGGPR